MSPFWTEGDTPPFGMGAANLIVMFSVSRSMTNPKQTIWQLVQRCARELTKNGMTPFTRGDLVRCVQRANPSYEANSINPIIQGVTDNLQGGAPGAVGKNILHRVGRGLFVLKDGNGGQLESLNAANRRGGRESRVTETRPAKRAGKAAAGSDDGITLSLTRLRWTTVFEIPASSVLPKGRKGLSRDVILAARSVPHRFGCYCWASTNNVLYCGSFSRDYSNPQFQCNFEGRIHQYFCTHKREDGTAKNTNARVFDRLNDTLETAASIALQVFSFEDLRCNNEVITFGAYERDSSLVRAVEHVLIWMYKRWGQCVWNEED